MMKIPQNGYIQFIFKRRIFDNVIFFCGRSLHGITPRQAIICSRLFVTGELRNVTLTGFCFYCNCFIKVNSRLLISKTKQRFELRTSRLLEWLSNLLRHYGRLCRGSGDYSSCSQKFCVKSVCAQVVSGPYSATFGSEKLQIRTLFMQYCDP